MNQNQSNSRVWLYTICLLALLLVACGGGETAVSSSEESAAPAATSTPTGDAAHGEELYSSTCISCHGPGGIGIENLGKDMTTSQFIRDSSDEELVAFIKIGRPVGDPDNSTGVDMPPKGGNPALTDDDILDIVAYIRSLQAE